MTSSHENSWLGAFSLQSVSLIAFSPGLFQVPKWSRYPLKGSQPSPGATASLDKGCVWEESTKREGKEKCQYLEQIIPGYVWISLDCVPHTND